MSAGSVMAIGLTGVIHASSHWSTAYYIYGCLIVLWLVPFIVLFSNKPRKSTKILPIHSFELNLIVSSRDSASVSKAPSKVRGEKSIGGGREEKSQEDDLKQIGLESPNLSEEIQLTPTTIEKGGKRKGGLKSDSVGIALDKESPGTLSVSLLSSGTYCR